MFRPFSDSVLVLPWVVAAIIFVLVFYRSIPRAKKLSFPPGPSKIPFLGNVFDIRKGPLQFDYVDWARRYGNIVHLRFLHRDIIILNSFKVAEDLLDGRSAIYSDRPPMPMMKDLIGWDWNFGFMNYGPVWRENRRIFHDFVKPSSCKDYMTMQEEETAKLLRDLLRLPDQFRMLIKRTNAAIVLRVAYGFDIAEADDKFVPVAEAAMESVAIAGTAGRFLVDIFPILKYLPSWLPGTDFKRKAFMWRKALDALRDVPLNHLKQLIEAKQPCQPSIASRLLDADRTGDDATSEDMVRNLPALAYGGGVDTTSAVLSTFFLAMVLHPSAQQRAQAELDAIVGPSRLPTFADRSKLPYVNALLKETIRWQPAGPIGIPHCLTSDDEYQSYLLPKGSVIIPNVWGMMHDEGIYQDPFQFKPERFLKDGLLDPCATDPIAVFGFGRRICPGRHLADNSLFIAIAQILACFNILHEVNANGIPIPVEAIMKPGVVSCPEDFRCSITPRSLDAAALVSQSTI